MKPTNTLFGAGLFLVALFVVACGSAPSDGEADRGSEMASDMQYTLTPFTPSAAYPDASIDGYRFENGTYNFEISNYELGIQTPDADSKMCANSGQGQHIHLIIDNQPYSAQYTANFDYDIANGEHYMLAFLSRSYHESVKNPAARVADRIVVEDGTISARQPIDEPVLFYSRPKGTYVGEAETSKVMLDFYVLNTELSPNMQVKADINGEIHMIDTWQPYYIEGLPMGENTITLTLVDGDGVAVDAPLNPVTRTFTLQADPAEQM